VILRSPYIGVHQDQKGDAQMLLAGDIGGSKADLALYEPRDDATRPRFEATFKSAQFDRLEDIVWAFLASTGARAEYAAFGLAGPIVGGMASITNLAWEIHQDQLNETLGLKKTYMLNDIEAIAYAIPNLSLTDLHPIHEGEAIEHGNMAIVAPGTGLGEAFLTWDGKGYGVHPTEGGHTDFAPIDELQAQLLLFLLKEYSHISYERVCSGIGLPNIYRFLKANGYADEPAWLARELAEAMDPVPVIVGAAAGDSPCALSKKTIDLFSSILGAECGNMALRAIANGGVYIAGGMVPRMLSLLNSSALLESFVNKGRLSDFVKKVPVRVVINPKTALIGAATYGLGKLSQAG
jgi:glucokinase